MQKKKFQMFSRNRILTTEKKNFNKKTLAKNWKKFPKAFKEKDTGHRKRWKLQYYPTSAMCLSNLSNRAFRSSLSLMTFDSSGSSEVKFCKGEIQYMYKEYWNSVENLHKCYPVFCFTQKLHKQITFRIFYLNNWC